MRADRPQPKRRLRDGGFASQRIARLFATLSATNEATTRARSPDELCRQLCDIAVQTGRFELAAVLLADGAAGRLSVAAVAGPAAALLHGIEFSVDEQQAAGRGLVGTAFRSGRACISNRLLDDPSTAPWHALARQFGVGSGAALPLVRGQRAVGVLVFYQQRAGAFDDECVVLLERMSANVSFAFDNFDRDAERRRAEQSLRDREARFRTLTELSSDWYWEQDEELRFVPSSDPRAIRYDQGAGGEERLCRWELPEAAPLSGSWAEHRALVGARQPFRDFEYSRLDEDGEPCYLSVSGAPVFDEHGRFTGYCGVGRDITGRKRAEERIQYLATHDGLTGLPNRALFSQLLNAALETARRTQRRLALLFIDLDRFKPVNDELGHAAGDELLKQLARRLRESLRASDAVARLGGDEFVVLLQELTDPQEAAVTARKLLAAAMLPIPVFGHECHVTASIGIALYPADALDENSLMKNADLAMYKAKEQGKNTVQFYSRDGLPH